MKTGIQVDSIDYRDDAIQTMEKDGTQGVSLSSQAEHRNRAERDSELLT